MENSHCATLQATTLVSWEDTVVRLQDVWDQIGLSFEEREELMRLLVEDIRQVVFRMEENQQERKDSLVAEMNDCHNHILHLTQQLGMKVQVIHNPILSIPV